MATGIIYLGSKMAKTPLGSSIEASTWEQIQRLENGSINPTKDTVEMLQWIALALPVDAYENLYTGDSKTIDLFLNDRNENGGSVLDDAVMRSFLGFRRPTTGDNIDTNRITFGKSSLGK